MKKYTDTNGLSASNVVFSIADNTDKATYFFKRVISTGDGKDIIYYSSSLSETIAKTIVIPNDQSKTKYDGNIQW